MIIKGIVFTMLLFVFALSLGMALTSYKHYENYKEEMNARQLLLVYEMITSNVVKALLFITGAIWLFTKMIGG